MNRMEEDSEYDISVSSDEGGESPHGGRVREVLSAALRRHEVRAARIHVALVGDDCIARLNDQYLGRGGATDVLAFDLREPDRESATGIGDRRGSVFPEETAGVEGEIVISTDTAAREASTRGHAYEAELALYALHGALHLLGYDDQEESAAVRMHAMEDEILTAVGLGTVFGNDLS